MTVSLNTKWTVRGKEYRLGGCLVGTASYQEGGMYDLHFHDDVPKNRWPCVVAGSEAADYVMLAVACDMVAGGPWNDQQEA